MLATWLRGLYRRFRGTPARKAACRLPRRRTRLHVEPLEDRILLAGQVFLADVTADRATPLDQLQGRTSNLSLREAIALANADGGDAVRLTAGATYAVAAFLSGQATGDLIINNSVTLDGRGATIDLGGSGRIFRLNTAGTVAVNNVTIRNGTGDGDGSGGAMQVNAGTDLTLNGVTFDNDNVTGTNGGIDANNNGMHGGQGRGGALFVNDPGGSVTISNCSFTHDSAAGGTGGGYNGVNAAGQGGDGLGGALFLGAGNLSITTSAFGYDNATAGMSGGAYGAPVVNADSVYGVAQGGAVYVSGHGQVSMGLTTFASDSVTGRTGVAATDQNNGEDGGLAQGGALFINNAGGSVTLTAVGMSDNTAQGGRGGDGYHSSDQGGKGGDAEGAALYLAAGDLTMVDGGASGNQATGGQTGWTGNGVLTGNADGKVFYVNDVHPYGSSEGGAFFLAGDGTVVMDHDSLASNKVVGRTGRDTLYQNNGEDAGNAEGGAMFIAMSGGSVTIDQQSTLTGNQAVGSAGGNAGGNHYDLSGKGGDAQGGAVYLNRGSLAINQTELGGNSVTAGRTGTGPYGVVAVAPDASVTPFRDPNRTSLADGGAVYVAGGSVSFTADNIHDNQATAADAQDFMGGSQGRDGGTARGGAVFIAGASGAVQFSGGNLTKNSVNGGAGGKADPGGNGGNGGGGQGGAVFLGSGSLGLTGTQLLQNSAFVGQGGTDVSGASGANGTAKGGAVYAQGNVTLSGASFGNNGAYGGPSQNTLSGVTAAGDPDNGGARGGDGGNAYGGAVYLVSGDLNVSQSAFFLNEAFGGNGGQGFELSQSAQQGTQGGDGGTGGNADGGAITSTSAGTLTIDASAFRQNLVLGGSGGRGGNGDFNNGSGGGGGHGGDGGNGGDAYGGALALSGQAVVQITHSDLVANKVGAGDGGMGGWGGEGGSGSSSSADPSETFSGGNGGDASNGGNGGNATGGAVWSDGPGLTFRAGSVVNNEARGGWGGDGGTGGTGSYATDYSFNSIASLFGATKNTDGGNGGHGGDGGNGGAARGGGFAVLGGSALIQDSSVLNNAAVAGFGADGGQGGNAGNAAHYGTDGQGGTGGNGGNGGDAQGGGVWSSGQGQVRLINDTVANNDVESGGAGTGGWYGGTWQDPQHYHGTTQELIAEAAGVSDLFVAGGAAGVVSVLAPPALLTNLRAGAGAVQSAAQAASEAADVIYEAALEALTAANAEAASAAAEAAASGTPEAILAAEVAAEAATEAAAVATEAGLEATIAGIDAAATVTVSVVSTAAAAAAIGPTVLALGPVALPFLLVAAVPVAVYGVAAVAGGVAALVAQIQGNSASDAFLKIFTLITANGRPTGQYIFQGWASQPDPTPSPNVDGAPGHDGTNGTASGGGLYVVAGGQPASVENTILAQNTAADRSFQLKGYVPHGSVTGTGGFSVIITTDSNILDKQVKAVTQADPAVADKAGNLTDAGNNLIGVDPQFVVSRRDPLDPATVLAYAGGLPAFNQGNNAVYTPNALDQVGQARNLAGGVDVGAVERDPNPFFTPGPDQTILENVAGVSAVPQTVTKWATDITPGLSHSAGVPLAFQVVSDSNPGLFAPGGAPTIDADGTLHYTPATDNSGNATIGVQLADGSTTGSVKTFTINVTFVNHPPSFMKGSDQTVLEDSGADTVAGWATNVSPGPANQSGEQVTFHVTGDSNPNLFAVAPTVDPDGTLHFTPAAGATGSATITLDLQNNGGTANGGIDTSPTQSFTITVQPPSPPSQTVQAATGDEGRDAAIPLSIQSALTDDPSVGPETLSIQISGVPAGDKLSAGTDSGNGTWTLTPDQLAGLTLNAPEEGAFTLTVTATASAFGHDAPTVADLPVTVNNVSQTLVLVGPGTFDPQRPYTLSLGSFDVGTDALRHWTINWGDGTTDMLAGSVTQATHQYPLVSAGYQITATAADEDGTYAAVNSLNVQARFDNPSTAFVAQVFTDLVNQPIDQTSLSAWAAELQAAWLMTMKTGSAKWLRHARQHLVQEIMHSPAYLIQEVLALYQSLYHRAPTADELARGVALLSQAGGSKSFPGHNLLARLLLSGEYWQKNGGTRQGWLAGLGKDILGGGRLPAGLDDPSLSRAVVVRRLLSNPGVLAAALAAAELRLLGSAADTAAMQTLRQQLQAGQSLADILADMVFASAAYTARANA
jgi:hypothetical protein